eukprot:4288011-Pleurochrysis_carterae.AAC.1
MPLAHGSLWKLYAFAFLMKNSSANMLGPFHIDLFIQPLSIASTGLLSESHASIWSSECAAIATAQARPAREWTSHRPLADRAGRDRGNLAPEQRSLPAFLIDQLFSTSFSSVLRGGLLHKLRSVPFITNRWAPHPMRCLTCIPHALALSVSLPAQVPLFSVAGRFVRALGTHTAMISCMAAAAIRFSGCVLMRPASAVTVLSREPCIDVSEVDVVVLRHLGRGKGVLPADASQPSFCASRYVVVSSGWLLLPFEVAHGYVFAVAYTVIAILAGAAQEAMHGCSVEDGLNAAALALIWITPARSQKRPRTMGCRHRWLVCSTHAPSCSRVQLRQVYCYHADSIATASTLAQAGRIAAVAGWGLVIERVGMRPAFGIASALFAIAALPLCLQLLVP